MQDYDQNQSAFEQLAAAIHQHAYERFLMTVPLLDRCYMAHLRHTRKEGMRNDYLKSVGKEPGDTAVV